MKPELTISEIQTTVTILAGSGGGVTTGSTVGNEFSGSDVTYSRRSNTWDEDE